MRLTAAVFRHQARLLGRTGRELIRQPAVGREVMRLVATRGRSTIELRLPWLSFRLIDDLAAIVGPGTRVFEFGGGGSTLWLLDRGATVVTVEHDAGWAASLRNQVHSEKWTMLERGSEDSFESYIGAIDGYADESFDVVLVDGRERARCVAASLNKVRPGGLLVVDDSDRERYQSAIGATGWPRQDVVGFAPAKPTLAYSAVLRRPEVDG